MPNPDDFVELSPLLAQTTALVLAGGRGARMGGVDKGLQPYMGQPLVLHALQRLARQQGGPLHSVLVSANRNLAQYAALGITALPDSLPDFAGPLAGFLVGLEHCTTPYLLTVPCDSPLFPLDLAQRLMAALQKADADVAVAAAPDVDAAGVQVLHNQPVFCLLKTHLQPSLLQFLQEGGRKIGAWTAQHHRVLVPFDAPGDAARAFANANTLDDLRALEQP
jgi:molybdopterin-guanine dinucleotide biosynthesis protein A